MNVDSETHVDSPKWNAMRRAQIELQNQLARAVRQVHNLYCDCPEHLAQRRANAAFPFSDSH